MTSLQTTNSNQLSIPMQTETLDSILLHFPNKKEKFIIRNYLTWNKSLAISKMNVKFYLDEKELTKGTYKNYRAVLNRLVKFCDKHKIKRVEVPEKLYSLTNSEHYEVLKPFLNTLNTSNTKESYGLTLIDYFNYLAKEEKPSDDQTVREYLSSFNNANTYNVKLACLKAFAEFTYTRERRALSDKERRDLKDKLDMIKEIKPKKVNKLLFMKSVLSLEQVEELIEQAPDELKYHLHLGFYAGLRISETLNAKIEDDFIYLSNTKSQMSQSTRLIKPNPYKQTITDLGVLKSRVYLYFQKIKVQLGKENLSFHSLRHSIAMHLRAKGYGIEQIQLFLRHADIKNTMIYAKSRDVKNDLMKLEI